MASHYRADAKTLRCQDYGQYLWKKECIDEIFPSNSRWSNTQNGGLPTPVDIKMYPDKYEYIIDMPGSPTCNENINVQVLGSNELVITGTRRREDEDGFKYLMSERKTGDFDTRFRLPQDANTEEISADRNVRGLLIVTVMKSSVAYDPTKPQMIEVRGE